MSSSILITGATGFVGHVLCASLRERNSTIKTVSRTVTTDYQIPSIDADVDWSDSLAGVNTVIHLAARVHVMDEYIDDSLSAYVETNVAGTLNLARQAAHFGIRRFIFVSSIKVNGEFTTKAPFSECDVVDPQDAYGVSKWQAEKELKKLSLETGMEVVIIRPPLVYGPGVKANFLSLLQMVNRGVPLPLGAINNQRSMLYVGNLVDALILCIYHCDAAGKTYLLSDGEDVSTPELVRRIAVSLRRPARLLPMPVGLLRCIAKLFGKSAMLDRLTQSLVIDSDCIRKELGWAPPYTMKEGLEETAVWFKSLNRNS